MRRFAPLMLLLLAIGGVGRADEEKPVTRDYSRVIAASAPQSQSWEDATAKSASCRGCHTASDQKTMHASTAVVLGCVDCHGGNAALPVAVGIARTDPRYDQLRDDAHVLPRFPHAWGFPRSANPKRSYTLLNRESPEFIRFKNPSDYRVARQSCGACHQDTIDAAERSIMATGAMFWEGASYNNGILPFKRGVIGEAFTRSGDAACLLSPDINPAPTPRNACIAPLGANLGLLTDAARKRGALDRLLPLPTWQVVPPADVFRVFERGGRNVSTEFAEVGLPNSTGLLQRLEEPGRPDIRQSNRGPGTGLRVAIPVLNIHKTRLNDPFMWFMGTNDQPGDYRTSGCGGCHVVYANDREPRHSLTYAQYGRDGMSATVDPTIPHDESGHPIQHAFTRAIPTAQCMNCHMHQPNMFLNSYLGYTMWDYEADAPSMWPEKQKYPNAAVSREILDRNPEAAAPYGKWGDTDFLRNVYDLNPKLKDTQFADYHGHGWNFRAVLKRDRNGNLLDGAGDMATYGTDTAHIVSPDDPEKWRKAGVPKFAPAGAQPGKVVHMMSIHAEVGMQCADCHFAQDSHGSGMIFGEVANAVEIGCKDCHGTADAYPTLRTSNLAARPEGKDLTLLRNPDGQLRFEWVTRDGQRTLIQRSIIDPKIEWKMSLVKDSVDPASPRYNAKAARAKLMGKVSIDGQMRWGPQVSAEARAHSDSNMACYSCHLAWTTSCGGCHLPIEANWKTDIHKYEGGETRNWASYNPEVARDDIFQLGKHMTTKGNIIAPVRSTSALVLSSTNVNRDRIYVQQPPISAGGFSSQAFAPHYPHTERRVETKTCTDCHLSQANDNNAWMAQLMLLGTNYVNFVGLNAWVGEDGGLSAIRVTEWREPQAVIGSYLQKYAYPDWYKLHVDKNDRELKNWTRGEIFDKSAGGSGETNATEQFVNNHKRAGGPIHCLQLRGEYLFTAEGKSGFRAYDVASIANKSVSERILTGPVSPLGQNTRVASRNATCMALPTGQPIDPTRNTAELRALNEEQAFHPIYNYAFVTDAEEGLILVDIRTLADKEPRNNFLRRALTWNDGHVLDGARHITLGGNYAYITAKAGLVVVDLSDPLHPKATATVPLTDPRASALQFRYLYVTDTTGLRVMDVTDQAHPRLLPATVPLADARKLYLARTYAYVAAKGQGLAIVDITRAETPKLFKLETAQGKITDAEDVIVGTTNASLFAYVADGVNGLKVLQLTSPASQANLYGFSPEPRAELIAWAKTPWPALGLSKGLDRDRAVDESGNQIAVFGRVGSRPFTRPEMEAFFRAKATGQLYWVTDAVSASPPIPYGR